MQSAIERAMKAGIENAIKNATTKSKIAKEK
jgi:hypothetical protein